MIRCVACALLGLLMAGPAFGHAMLAKADPPAGATLPASPPSVTITFTEAVEPRFSRIEVDDATGARVDAADLHAAGDHGKTLAVGLPKLAPGRYTVVWHATSVDTHKTQGRFDFAVGP